MNLVRVASPDEVRPRHVAVAIIVFFTLLASCLLTCGSGSVDLPDGAQSWRPDSLFRAAVELLNLHGTQPTQQGVEIKWLVFRLGTALALVTVGVALSLRPRGDEEIQEGDTVIADPVTADLATPTAKKHISPLLAAQVMMLLYVAWSFAGIAWSDARDIAFYGSLELALCAAWPFAIAYGLNRSSFRYAAYALVGVAGGTGLMAVLYVRERNPSLRASYPIGNPLPLAACLLPGLLVGFGVVVAKLRDFGNPQRGRRAAAVVLALAAVLIAAWAFWRADSRGAYVALVAGAAALVFFATSGRTRLIALIVGLVLAALTVYALGARVSHFSPTGRDATLRERYHTWGYALDLIGQRKLLGHGQGGYTRKADALAAGADVLEDPEALANARVANAHNEWLEVWTDLGSIGLVMVAGSLLLSIAAGIAALPSLGTLTQRWTLIALLASLSALIVEESTSVGLRLAGLPPIFYALIGLIWAACTPDPPAPIRLLRRNAATRAATFVLSLSAAATAIYLGFADFQAARAEFEVAKAIDDLRWDEAIRLAERAWTRRLNPHHRLVAQERLSETYLHLARAHQVNGLRRIQTAMQSDPPDPQRLQLGQQDAEIAEGYRRRGMVVLEDLVRQAPNFYNSNWIEYEFEQIRAEFARFRGDADAARQLDQQSAVKLQRELERRPYDANMAGRLVLASGSTMSVEDICRILARPLRYNPVPPLYYEIAARVISVPAFMEKFAPVYQKINSGPPLQAIEADPLAPEQLRLASVIWYQEGEPDVSERALESACALYEVLPPRFALAAAACYAELADRRFFNHPTEPTQAMRDAEQAIRRAPSSNEGRRLVIAIKEARVAMLLAVGEEAAAREALLELRPKADDAAVKQHISARYASLAAGVMQRDSASYLDALRRWVDRAIQIDPGNLPAWQQRADLAFRDEDDAECVRFLREARKLGAGDDFMYRFVDMALSKRPTSRPLLEYRDELASEMRQASPPPRATPDSP